MLPTVSPQKMPHRLISICELQTNDGSQALCCDQKVPGLPRWGKEMQHSVRFESTMFSKINIDTEGKRY